MHTPPATMEANQSIQSILIHNGLSAEKQEAAREFYQQFLRNMGSASECGLDFQFVFQMTVMPSAKPSGEEMPSAIIDASATDLIGPDTQTLDERLEQARQEGVTQGLQELEEKYAKELAAVEARHKREMADKDKRYVDALGPLLGVRDRVLAECEKKCHDAERKGYAAGYAFSDQKWNPVYQAVCEDLEAVRKEGANWEASYIRLLNERDEAILAEVDLRRELDAMAEGSEKLEAQVEGLRKQLDSEEDAATDIYRAMRADLERLSAENEKLQKKHDALLELVGPTQKLMTSNPELFGGEVKGTSSPRPPAIVRFKEEDEERVEKFLKGLVRPVFRDGSVVESAATKVTALPGLEDAEPSTEGLCCAWPIEEDQPRVCGAAGCIDCPAASAAVDAKPKPNYNHQFWPSPITKRFAKHLAKHSGGHDPKAIKTHQDALDFIAKRAKVSVETLLTYPIKHYQTSFEPWTVAKGPNNFHMGTAPATWWS